MKTSKDKDQDVDKRRDDLAKRVLNTPPKPKTAEPKTKKRQAEARRPPVSDEDKND